MNRRKIFSFLIALTFVFTLGAVAFATDGLWCGGSIFSRTYFQCNRRLGLFYYHVADFVSEAVS